MSIIENFLKEIDLAPVRFKGFHVKNAILAIAEEVRRLNAVGDLEATSQKAKEGLAWLRNHQRRSCRESLREEAVQASMGNFLAGRKLDRDLKVRFERLLVRLRADAEILIAENFRDLKRASEVYLFLYRELDSIKDQFLLREKKRHSLGVQRDTAKLRRWNSPSKNAGRTKNVGKLHKRQQEAMTKVIDSLSEQSTGVAV